MKKILALLLAVAIVMTMSIPAFAEELDETVTDHSGSKTGVNTSAEIGVYGNYLAELESDKVLSVIVSWTDMYFQYAKSQQGTWDPVTHTYTGADNQAKWLKDTATITLENHSNTAITANLAFQKASSDSNVTGQFDEDEVELATAVGTDKDNAPSDNVVFTIGGSISEGETELGTISVSLNANQTDTDDGDNGDNGGIDSNEPAEDTTNYLNLSGVAFDDGSGNYKGYNEAVATYLAEIDPDKNGGVTLPLKLGVTETSEKQGNAISNAIYAYYDNNSAKKVDLVIYDVTTVGSKTFSYGGSGINSVTFTNATELDAYAFYNFVVCSEINLPKVTKIGQTAFSGYTAVTSLKFGSVVQTVGSSWMSYSTTDINNITLTLNPNQGDIDGWNWALVTNFAEDNDETYPNGSFGGCGDWKTVVKG